MLTEDQIIDHIGRATPIGLGIVLLANVICFTAGSLLAKNLTSNSTADLITIILGVVAVSDIAVGFIVKKRLLQPLFKPEAATDANSIDAAMTKTTIIVSAICAAPPIYGLVAVLLGSKNEYLAGFMIISLAGYLALRLRPKDFKKLITL